jgi:hypothetical protein
MFKLFVMNSRLSFVALAAAAAGAAGTVFAIPARAAEPAAEAAPSSAALLAPDGAAIALSGCLQGMHAGNSSAAVGQATTRAVVAAITAVIVIDSAFAAIFTVLDI